MDPSAERDALRGLLDALDQAAPDLHEQVAQRPREGVLLGACEHHGLDDVDVLLLLGALRELLAGRPQVRGDDLVRQGFGTTAGRLEALAHLDGDGPLVSRGFLLPEVVPAHPAEAQCVLFRLGEHAFRLACEVFEREPRAAPPERTGPYGTNADALADLRRLSLHFRRRAARVFHLDPWTGTGIEVLDGTTALVDRARAETRRVSERLAVTPTDDERFPLLALRREHDLSVDELVLLVTVLFQELVEGMGVVDAADLVKLVSESETELVRRRTMLRPLARKGLLRLEGTFAGKDLTADVSLPAEVIEAMLGEQGTIEADERLDFHAYLQQLESSEAFFRELDGE